MFFFLLQLQDPGASIVFPQQDTLGLVLILKANRQQAINKG